MAAPSVNLNKTYIYGPDLPEDADAILMVNPILGGASNPDSFEFDRGGTGLNASLSSNGSYVGGLVNFSTSYDITQRKYLIVGCWHRTTRYVERYIEELANGGLSIMFADANNNYEEYYLAGRDYYSNFAVLGSWVKDRDHKTDGTGQFCIDLNRTPDASSGTLDRTAITKIQLNHRHVSTGAYSGNYNVGVVSFFVTDPESLVGGEVGSEAGFSDLSDALTAEDPATDRMRYVNQWTSLSIDFAGQPFTTYCPRREFIIDADHFSDQNTAIYMYPSVDNFGPGEDHTSFLQLTGTPNRVIEDQLLAGRSRSYNGTVFSGRDGFIKDWSMRFSGQSLEVCECRNMSFYNGLFVELNSSHAHNNPTFNNIDEVRITQNTNLTAGILRNCAGKGFYIIDGPADYSGITGTIEDSNTGDEITIAADVEGIYDLRGFRAQGQTINVEYEGSNTIEVKLDSSVTATWSSAGGGTVNIDNSVSSTLTLTDLKNPTEVRVYDAGTTTEIIGQESVTSGTFSGQIPPQYSAIDISILSLSYQNIKLKNISTSSDINIPISQVLDRQYLNP